MLMMPDQHTVWNKISRHFITVQTQNQNLFTRDRAGGAGVKGAGVEGAGSGGRGGGKWG